MIKIFTKSEAVSPSNLRQMWRERQGIRFGLRRDIEETKGSFFFFFFVL